MAKICEAYGRSKHPKAKKVKGRSFRYADLGNCYSYVELNYEVGKKTYSEQLKIEKFFEWIGEQLLEKKND